MHIHIRFGALSDPIKKQLEEQNLVIDDKDCELIEELKHSILMCSFHGLITDSIKDKAFDKLFKKLRNKVNLKQ